MGRRGRAQKATGGLWLTFFLTYWAWHLAGIVGVALLIAIVALICGLLARRDRAAARGGGGQGA